MIMHIGKNSQTGMDHPKRISPPARTAKIMTATELATCDDVENGESYGERDNERQEPIKATWLEDWFVSFGHVSLLHNPNIVLSRGNVNGT